MWILSRVLDDLDITGRIGADQDGYPGVLGYHGPSLTSVMKATVTSLAVPIERMMARKSDAEIALIRQSARWCEHAHRLLQELGLPSILDSSVAKCFANEIAREVSGHAVQLMGGYGYSREYPMERRLRDAWGWGIAGGAIDIQKVNIAGAMVGRRFDQRR